MTHHHDSTPRPGLTPTGAVLTALACLGLAGVALAPARADAQQATSAGAEKKTAPAPAPAVSRHLERNGVAIDLDIGSADGKSGAVEDHDMRIGLKIRDASTGDTLTTSRKIPAGWIDVAPESGTLDSMECRRRVAKYLSPKVQLRMSVRPAIDLTSYYLLTLNRGNSISVLDPFFGFGSSRMYATVVLPGQGEDWVDGPDDRFVYVTIPQENLLAVVSTGTWKVVQKIAMPTRPMRIRYDDSHGLLWVANDAGKQSGLTAIDPKARKVVAHVATGAGHHEFIFSPDGGRAFVTNPDAGTVTVVDTRTWKKLATVSTGHAPTGLAWSTVGKGAYVTDPADGTIVRIDGKTLEPTDRLTGSTGLSNIFFDHTGRWGFITNPDSNSVYIMDATTNKVEHDLDIQGQPYQVVFSKSFAYIRSKHSKNVMMVTLKELGTTGPVPSAFASDYNRAGKVTDSTGLTATPFPAGNVPPDQYGDVGIAQAIGRAPQRDDAVYIPSAGDKAVYYYHYMEGMPTPSGSLDNGGLEPMAALTVGRHLHRMGPGEYSAKVRAPGAGRYNFVLLIDQPRVVRCIPFSVGEDTKIVRKGASLALRIHADPEASFHLSPRQVSHVRFRLEELRTGREHGGLDVEVRVMNTAGWEHRTTAKALDDGSYEVPLRVPSTGIYYMTVDVPSLSKGYRSVPPATLVAGKVRTQQERLSNGDAVVNGLPGHGSRGGSPSGTPPDSARTSGSGSSSGSGSKGGA